MNSTRKKYYENGTAFEDGPSFAKRWSHHQQSGGPHHLLQHQSHLVHSTQHQASELGYCWYTQPLGQGPGVPSLVQISGGVPQSGLGGYGPPPPPVSHLPLQHANISHSGTGTSGSALTQNGSASLDDDWRNIHVLLDCVLGMVQKTKRAVTILQKRGCTSPATAAPTTGSNLQVNGGGQTSGGNNGIEASSDRDGTFKRLSAEFFRANEDRIAEVKRQADEAVQEVRRAAMKEVQRAVALAMAESRANERFRNQRYLDNLPVNSSPQRNHHPQSIRPSPFLRITESRLACTGATTTTTSVVGSSTSSITTNNVDELDKDSSHISSGIATNCWNCGRPALETCGGCGIARYCGAFCQLRDWEASHYATCSNGQNLQEQTRSSSPTPPIRTTGGEPKSSSSISLSASIARTVK